MNNQLVNQINGYNCFILMHYLLNLSGSGSPNGYAAQISTHLYFRCIKKGKQNDDY